MVGRRMGCFIKQLKVFFLGVPVHIFEVAQI